MSIQYGRYKSDLISTLTLLPMDFPLFWTFYQSTKRSIKSGSAR